MNFGIIAKCNHCGEELQEIYFTILCRVSMFWHKGDCSYKANGIKYGFNEVNEFTCPKCSETNIMDHDQTTE